jgi:hypothetical protein
MIRARRSFFVNGNSINVRCSAAGIKENANGVTSITLSKKEVDFWKAAFNVVLP